MVALFGLPLSLLTLLVRAPRREANAGPGHPGLRSVLAYIAANGRAFTGVYLGYPLIVVMSFAQLFWGRPISPASMA